MELNYSDGLKNWTSLYGARQKRDGFTVLRTVRTKTQLHLLCLCVQNYRCSLLLSVAVVLLSSYPHEQYLHTRVTEVSPLLCLWDLCISICCHFFYNCADALHWVRNSLRLMERGGRQIRPQICLKILERGTFLLPAALLWEIATQLNTDDDL